jgi:hypothetical protein
MVVQLNNLFYVANIKIVFIALLACGLSACGQFYKNHNHRTATTMNTTILTNHVVKDAFNAWQQGDSKLWLSHFTEDAKLLDDGHLRDFKKFSTEAIGHERFTSIDKVENNNLSIYGKFHSDTWGDFKTYFKFHINEQGKIYKLEIGQADYK